jgi:hypothetical protein
LQQNEHEKRPNLKQEWKAYFFRVGGAFARHCDVHASNVERMLAFAHGVLVCACMYRSIAYRLWAKKAEIVCEVRQDQRKIL